MVQEVATFGCALMKADAQTISVHLSSPPMWLTLHSGFALEMYSVHTRIVPRITIGVVKAAVDNVSDSTLDCALVKPDSPVGLGDFAYSKAICIQKQAIATFGGGLESCQVVPMSSRVLHGLDILKTCQSTTLL